MPEHLRAFVVVLTLSIVTFPLVRRLALGTGMAPDVFARRRNLWLATTSAAFLTSNFWIFIIAMSALLLIARIKERAPLSLYLFLVFAVPPFGATLSGLGIVNQLFELSFPRLLSLLVLLPWALRPRDPETPAFGKHLADWLLLSYLLLQLGSQLQVDTFTNTLRSGLYVFLDALLPYYVASRALKTVDDYRDALLSFVIAVLMMVPIAAFEFLKHWLLYSAVADALGMQWHHGSYLARGDTLRAVVTTGHSISLGYVMMSAIMLHNGLRMAAVHPRLWVLGLAALGLGCIAAVSRGPWVGVVAGVIIFAAVSRQPGKGLLKLTLGAGTVAAALWMSPWGADLIDYLPFVGSVDSNNVDYRKQLFDVSMRVIAQNPVFGSPMFMYNSQMRELQNGTLIDIVNSYLLVALQSGYVGLALFMGVFGCAIWSVVAALRRQPDGHSERFLQGRALLAAMASILITIATVSNMGVIPIVYWCAAGLAIGYGRASLSDVRDSRPEPSRLAMRIS